MSQLCTSGSSRSGRATGIATLVVAVEVVADT